MTAPPALAVDGAPTAFVTLRGDDGRALHIEHLWITPQAASASAPLLVFLHEGLGSVSAWGDFPQRLCNVLGCRGLVYSRPGYGRSTPRAPGEHWAPGFMHRQALQLLPALLQALQVDTAAHPPWLLGHSDGGTIALLHAAHFAGQVSGVVVLAPHIDVEAVALASIAKARDAYLHGALRQRLARHHADVDSAFWGWNDVWLSPAFSSWSVADEIGSIACPLLAVQGLDDAYGTLAQVRGIARRVPQTRLLELPDCGHAPQRDQPAALIAAVAAFWHDASSSAPLGTMPDRPTGAAADGDAR